MKNNSKSFSKAIQNLTHSSFSRIGIFFLSALFLNAIFLISSCKKDNSVGKKYKIDIAITSKVHVYKGEDMNGYSRYDWETSGSSNYTVYLNENDNGKIDYPATVTTKKVDDNSLNVTVNGDRCCVGLNTTCAIGNSNSSGYSNDDCGRTNIDVTVTKK